MVQTDLYFGQAIPGGGEISPVEWNKFKEEHISKVFGEGSTVHTVVGHWYDPEKKILITEPAYMVTHFYKRSKERSRQIDTLIERYKTMFHQQAVLRVDKKVKATFN